MNSTVHGSKNLTKLAEHGKRHHGSVGARTAYRAKEEILRQSVKDWVRDWSKIASWGKQFMADSQSSHFDLEHEEGRKNFKRMCLGWGHAKHILSESGEIYTHYMFECQHGCLRVAAPSGGISSPKMTHVL